MHVMSEGKSSWPELVATDGFQAMATIKAQNSHVTSTPVLIEGSVDITDFRCDRVVIWVTYSDIITLTPVIG